MLEESIVQWECSFGTEEVGFHMSLGCDVMINCGEKQGFYLEKLNGLENGRMLDVVDRGCDGKVGKFSRGLVQNEDERTVIQSSDGGCAVSNKNLVFRLNNGVQIEKECEDAAATKVAEVSLDMEDLFSTKSFLSDAQVNVIQDYIQYSCCALDLVVDLNSYKNTREDNDNVPRDSVFSDSNYRVSDLVWGKVRGHPWWPGQIYDPSIASEMAKCYQKENCYLIAYFGEQKFAWNEVSKIKPFHKHFSEMAKQTNCEIFRFAVDCALEEASRQVALGLSCPCFPEEVSSNAKTHVVANAEIHNQSFEPAELVNVVQSLAQSPLTEFDRLDLVSARGQLSAFYRSKGYLQLPEFAVLDRLFVPDMEILSVREEKQRNDQVLKTGQCFFPDLISEKNSWTPNGECTLEKKAGDNPTSRRGKKRKVSHDPSYDYIQDFQIEHDKSTSRRGRKPKAAYYTSDDCFQNFQIAVNNSTPRKRGRKPKLACKTYDNCFNNSQTGNSTGFQNVSVHDMWSQLCFAAKGPAGESCYTNVIDYFADFRKVTGRNNSAFLEQGFSLEQKYDGQTGAAATASVSTPMDLGVIAPIEADAVASVMEHGVATSSEVAAEASVMESGVIASLEAAAEASVMERGVITCLETAVEASVMEPGVITSLETTAKASVSTPMKLGVIKANALASAPASISTTPMELYNDCFSEEETDFNKKEYVNNAEQNLITEHFNQVEHASESSPTAFTLKFTNFDSVPLATDLNQIFSRFGPLIESKTELLERTKCIRVVFKRRIDAESAFCSAGQYSIFGPSLKSYRLKILPPMPKKAMVKKRGRKRKKEIASMEAAAL